jgi:catechol 1,2-dioxygenase
MISTPEQLTQAVLAVMQQTTEPRLREIMLSLVKHLHGFVLETKLTEAEFRNATALINQLGQLSNDTHNEAVLMSGSLGVAALVCLINNSGVQNEGQATQGTSQNLLGPFWRMHSPITPNGGSLLRSATPGPLLWVKAKFVNAQGVPVANAEVDVWHASTQGLYENQDDSQAEMNLRGKFMTDVNGEIWFNTIKPIGYPIPTNGLVGQLLKAQNRHPYRPAHIHFLAFKVGYKTLISQVYASDDPNLATDTQFGVTETLVGQYQIHHQAHPQQAERGTPWYALEYTFVMQAGEAVLPKPPIK